ncbi:kinase-like protein [Pseudovirgaria hyperparasitica]|uniref:non-specific serine/threonine protein kinase n=1 Tax=Pseudovirgaria hyperparasitica TaxID=470096 RepID=A0A6A6WCN7_9PEZI|nr:kinase-like protein [Pseudovirgaria hyperparasitica]KAF2760335.1 kinase-like protein [Pseudovirgaria hyperparasitica]
MAETPPQRNLSLVPYLPAESRQIVLRHGSAVVVFDQRSKQLSLRDASRSDAVELSDCPYCHRPLREEPDPEVYHDNEHEADTTPAPGFVNPEYFRMLQSSAPGSTTSTRPPSPVKRIRQPVVESDDYTRTPPAEAEFIGSAPAPQTTPASQNISTEAFSQGYFKTFFVEEKELGRGGKGVVLLVRHVLDGVSLGHFACKRVPVGDDHEWLRKVLIEVQVLQNLSHQNLVSYRHIWLEDWQLSSFGPRVPCAFILQQYCNAGDLYKYIAGPTKTTLSPQELKDRRRRHSKGQLEFPLDSTVPKRLTFDEIVSFTRDITAGLHHLHTNRYIHRDLKPSNCLLQRTGLQSYKVLLSDFGEVQLVNVDRKSTGATGTISYCAPEVLRRDLSSGALGNFTTKSDIFSLGMIVHFMCFSRLPYRNADGLDEDNEDVDQLKAEIVEWAGFEEDHKNSRALPELLFKFLKRLLSLEPAQRPNTLEILKQFNRGTSADELPDFSGSFVAEDMEPRISSVDSPTGPSRQSSARKTPTRSTFVRPGPSKLRHSTVEPSRSPSPPSDNSVADSTTCGPENSGVVLRTHKATSRATSPHLPDEGPQRLLLPPPPTFTGRIYRFLEIPIVVFILKTSLFLAKAVSILNPCSTLSPNPWVTYPLLCVAALDFSFLKPHDGTSFGILNGSLVLLGVHVAALVVATYFGLLCSIRLPIWHEGPMYTDDM